MKTLAEFSKISREQQQFNREKELHYLMYGTPWQRFRKEFWKVIYNLKSLIVFLVVLPVLPIIYIILAIRGELDI